jgi:hypothetical protein
VSWSRAELDDAVAAWNRDLALASQNVLELMDEPYYRWLAGASVTGATQAAAAPALAALDSLWQLLPALDELLADVNQRHRRLPRKAGPEQLAAIEALLAGDSIRIATRTSFGQRGLLTPEEIVHARSPRAILDAMVAAYAEAKAIVLQVGDAVRAAGGRLAEARRALNAANADGELAALDARLGALEAQLGADPLAAAGAIDGELAALAAARARSDAERGERDAAAGALAAAPAQLRALEAAFAEATAAFSERVAKVAIDASAPGAPTPFADAVIADLAAWLARLERAATGGGWRAAALGLGNWRAQIDARLAECRAVVRDNGAPVRRRRELRGLLESLKAKAVATGLGENEALSAIYQRARALLHARPTPLGAAERLVSDYLAGVSHG